MEGLKPHTNLKELIIKYFKGKMLASWITMMTNLVKIDLGDCKVMGSDFYGGLSSCSSEFSESRAAKTVTTMYPSLTKLHLWDLPNLEEWLEPVMSRGDEDQSTVLAFPKLEDMTIEKCPKLTRIPNSCLSSLKKLGIQDLDSSSLLLETMRRIVRALKYLYPRDISDGGGSLSSSSSSNTENKIERVLKNNSPSLTSLTVNNCKTVCLPKTFCELLVFFFPAIICFTVRWSLCLISRATNEWLKRRMCSMPGATESHLCKNLYIGFTGSFSSITYMIPTVQ